MNTSTVFGSWLYGNFSDDKPPYGYWTSTGVTNSTNAWAETRFGYLATYTVVELYYGIRPVITISKSQLS